MNNTADKIKSLKNEKNALILAHNYQLPEIQDIADFAGDSLELSRKAAKTDADIIVFCGVHFMAETAKMLSPDKKVLLPDLNAGCRMADMISKEKLQKLKDQHPDAVVVCYVNSTAEIKAISDYCCTSANAVKVVEAISKDKEIIFAPDKYLGSYAQKQTGRKMIMYNGFCPSHITMIGPAVLKQKQEHPKAELIAHPECRPDVLEIADKVASTSGILRHAKESDKKEYIIATETGILHRLQKENPDKTFYPASELAICPNMKMVTLEKLLLALEKEQFEITVEEEIAKKAKLAIDRMMEII